jgi:hypothetical protein
MSKSKANKSRYWSSNVTASSNAMDLEPGVFTFSDPKRIARSIMKSAMNSKRLKASPYKSAMSMINFYINRAGTNLSPERIQILNEAKQYLKFLFNK